MTRLNRLSTSLFMLLGLLSGCSGAHEPGLPTAVASAPQDASWHIYADPDGDSSVVEYRMGPGFIEVRFSDGSQYLYTDVSAGATNIARMQQLAAQGDGLGSFIQTNVYDRYASKS